MLFLVCSFTAGILVLACFSCAHISDTCDTYCLRHGGQCNGVEYGASRYDTITGDTKTKPTIFHCKFIN
jgi:hypothetical protein